MDLYQTAKRTVAQYGMIAPGDRVLAAVSGGADSVAMLFFLSRLRQELDFTLTAAHVHHGLRGAEADADLALTADLCRALAVPLAVHRADVAAICRQTGEGEEACGRRIRYEFFEQEAGGGRIATAHTADDDAETLLLHLLRGSGLSGLCGIPPVRGSIIRPLIACDRAAVEEYCARNGLSYAIDRTNRDERYRRNLVRRQLMPVCKQINPSFLKAAGRTAALNRRDRAYLETVGARLLDESRTQNGYRLHALASAEEAPLYYALRALLAPLCGGKLCESHLSAAAALIRAGGGSLDLPQRVTLWIENGVLHAGDPPEPIAPFCLPITPNTPCSVDGRILTLTAQNEQKIYNSVTYNRIDRDTIGTTLTVRNRRPGDRITLPGRGCTKTLKKLFNERKIPPRRRDRLLIVCDETGVVWVEGVGCDARTAPTEATRQALIVTIEDAGNPV